MSIKWHPPKNSLQGLLISKEIPHGPPKEHGTSSYPYCTPISESLEVWEADMGSRHGERGIPPIRCFLEKSLIIQTNPIGITMKRECPSFSGGRVSSRRLGDTWLVTIVIVFVP